MLKVSSTICVFLSLNLPITLANCVLTVGAKYLLKPLESTAIIFKSHSTTLKFEWLISLRINSLTWRYYALWASLGTVAAVTNYVIIRTFSLHFYYAITCSLHFSLNFLKISTAYDSSYASIFFFGFPSLAYGISLGADITWALS